MRVPKKVLCSFFEKLNLGADWDIEHWSYGGGYQIKHKGQTVTDALPAAAVYEALRLLSRYRNTITV